MHRGKKLSDSSKKSPVKNRTFSLFLKKNYLPANSNSYNEPISEGVKALS